LEEALQFFENVIGRPASPAEQQGNFGLDVLFSLLDARLDAAIDKALTPNNERTNQVSSPREVTSA
jgi:hypothetical protein